MGPLEGIRVLDLSRLIPGPFATLVLRDLGAAVDKVEDAGAGDYLRVAPPHRGGVSVAFEALNRGKRSLVLDLKKPEGRAAFEKLSGHYDVLFEQFRPGVLDRLGLGHASLRARHPRLIICALTGYGQTGPMAHRAGHDINYLARSGLLGFQGPEGAAPQVPGVQLADVSGGMWCAIAILGALRQRDASGQGTVLDIAMTEGVLGFATLSLAAALAEGEVPRGAERLTGGLCVYQTYLSKDGAPMTIGALEPKFWLAFCAGTGLPPDIEALMPGPHQVDLKRRLTEVFASRTRTEWIAFGKEHDCCVEPVLLPGELLQDEQLRERRLFEVQRIDGAEVPVFRTPITPRDADLGRAPHAGEHSRAVLTDAGFAASEVEALLASGAAVQHA